MELAEACAPLTGEIVVVDTSAPVAYIGRLVAADDCFLVLEEADVHDLRDAGVTREVHVMEAARDGVVANRRRVYVRQAAVLSISRLEDVRVF